MFILYFASQKNKIIGYKKELTSRKDSPKTEIAFLYFENEALFPKMCIKYADVNFQSNRITSNNNSSIIDYLHNFKANNIPAIFSINDLTELECNKILSNKVSLHKEYLDLYNEYLGDSLSVCRFSGYGNERDFSTDCFIPMMSNEHGKLTFAQRRMIKFIAKKIGINQVKTEIERIQKYTYHNITLPQKRVSELLIKLQALKKETIEIPAISIQLKNRIESDITLAKNEMLISNTFHSSWFKGDLKDKIKDEYEKMSCALSFCSNPTFVYNEYLPRIKSLEQRLKDYENQEKDLEKRREREITRLEEERRKIIAENNRTEAELETQKREKIVALEEEIKSIQKGIDYCQSQLIDEVLHYKSFITMYNNRGEIEKFINESVEKLYNILWLRTPLKMQELESHAFTASSIEVLIDNFSLNAEAIRNLNKSKILRWVFLRKEQKTLFRFIKSSLMTSWIKETEKLEEEQREIEREERRRVEEIKKREEEERQAQFRYNQKK